MGSGEDGSIGAADCGATRGGTARTSRSATHAIAAAWLLIEMMIATGSLRTVK